MSFRKAFSDTLFPLMGRLLKYRNKYVNVIYYHDIVTGENEGCMRMNLNKFFAQMEYIRSKGYETLTFDDLNDAAQIKFKNNRVLITFDDGWASNYSHIFEFMRKRGLKYNVFLAAGLIGNAPNYLTWDMVKEMYESGLVGFGAHTYNHVDMQDISKINVDEEVEQANSAIEKVIGVKPLDFCYPYGYYSEESNNYLLTNSSYKRIYTSKQMFSYDLKDGIIMGRNPIDSSEDDSIFEKKLKGLYNCYTLLRYRRNI